MHCFAIIVFIALLALHQTGYYHCIHHFAINVFTTLLSSNPTHYQHCIHCFVIIASITLPSLHSPLCYHWIQHITIIAFISLLSLHSSLCYCCIQPPHPLPPYQLWQNNIIIIRDFFNPLLPTPLPPVLIHFYQNNFFLNNFFCSFSIFTNSAPLGRVGHRVAMSVCVSVSAIAKHLPPEVV